MKRLGIIKSDDAASCNYVFINGQCYVTIFDTTQVARTKIVSSPLS